MSIILENIKTLCSQKGISLRQLEQACGLAPRYVYKWDTATPGIDKVEAVADYFKISIDELIGRKLPALSLNEEDALRLFRRLNKDGQEAALEYLELLQLKDIYKRDNQPGEMEA